MVHRVTKVTRVTNVAKQKFHPKLKLAPVSFDKIKETGREHKNKRKKERKKKKSTDFCRFFGDLWHSWQLSIYIQRFPRTILQDFYFPHTRTRANYWQNYRDRGFFVRDRKPTRPRMGTVSRSSPLPGTILVIETFRFFFYRFYFYFFFLNFFLEWNNGREDIKILTSWSSTPRTRSNRNKRFARHATRQSTLSVGSLDAADAMVPLLFVYTHAHNHPHTATQIYTNTHTHTDLTILLHESHYVYIRA